VSHKTDTFWLRRPDLLTALARCPDCSFHPRTQGHRDGCQHARTPFCPGCGTFRAANGYHRDDCTASKREVA